MARWTLCLLAGITAIGFILRVWEIGAKGLWLDEAFSVWLGWKSLGEMLAWLVRIDQHPPLYYALLHLWIKLAGDNPDDVRMLSAILGTLTIPVMFLLGRRLMGTTVGVLAALILALSPFHVRFAQETRMYTALTLNASLALLALSCLLTDARAAEMPIGRQLGGFYRAWRARRRSPLSAITTDLAWIGTAIFTTATLLSHNTAVLFLLATNLFVIGLSIWRRVAGGRRQEAGVRGQGSGVRGQEAGVAKQTAGAARPTNQPPDSDLQSPLATLQPPSLANWLIAQLGVFLLWSPWLVAFVIQAAGVDREFWISQPTLGVVLDTLKTFLSAMLPTGQIGWADAIWTAYGLLAILGIVHLRKQPALIAFLAVLFLTPIVGEWLVSLRRPIFSDRTLIWATLPLYLLLASGIAQLRYRPTILAAIVILVAVNFLSLRQYYIHFEKEAWDKAASYVGERVEKDDLLLFNATWVQIPFDYYYRYQNRPVAKHGAPVDLFDRGILEPRMAESDLPRLRELIADKERVWLIYSHNWYTDPQNLIPTTLSQKLKLLDQHQFNGLELRLYGRP
ncbi:MAG: glycosyltransferase family 39 protein [Anaerolineae bacterium]|nr:glycosyltransferase family 39 protein [Anaerolineae bacterium]